VVASLIYSLIRLLLDLFATGHGDQAELQAEVLALRRQVQVLERQIKRVRWTAGDRTVMAALRDLLPRSAWTFLETGGYGRLQEGTKRIQLEYRWNLADTTGHERTRHHAGSGP